MNVGGHAENGSGSDIDRDFIGQFVETYNEACRTLLCDFSACLTVEGDFMIALDREVAQAVQWGPSVSYTSCFIDPPSLVSLSLSLSPSPSLSPPHQEVSIITVSRTLQNGIYLLLEHVEKKYTMGDRTDSCNVSRLTCWWVVYRRTVRRRGPQ